MSLSVPFPGQILLLKYLLGLASVNQTFSVSSTNGPVLHLFINNATVNDNLVLGSLTEATSAGYAAITLASSGWTVTQSGGVTTGSYTSVTFNFTTNAVVYGYYITDTLTGTLGPNLLWAEGFGSSAPFNIPTSGGQVTIQSNINLAG